MIRFLTAGESHGRALIGIVEGIPAGVPITTEYVNGQLRRRQMGYGRGGRMRIEQDTVRILSGVRHGRTIGSPIALMIENKDHARWLSSMSVDPIRGRRQKVEVPRPGHADFAGAVKYGFDDIRNVIERASARETAMRVACSCIARRFLEECGVTVGSFVISIGRVSEEAPARRKDAFRRAVRRIKDGQLLSERADGSSVRMLTPSGTRSAVAEIRRMMKRGDTLGGIFEVRCFGLPVGLGSYVHYDRKLDGQLAQAMMSIHAIKGVEIGEGFHASTQPGSLVHDPFSVRGGGISRRTNNAGGLEGGVTNGEVLVVRAAMKPISTLAKPLSSMNIRTKKAHPGRYERSDVCAVPAASVIGESVVAPVLAQALLEKFGGDSLREVLKRLPRH